MRKTSIFLAFAVSSLLLGRPTLAAEELKGEAGQSRYVNSF